MNIGILGTGRMASALGSAWAMCGHKVCFGSREPLRAKAVADSIQMGAESGSYAQAASFGEVLLLASVWKGVEKVIEAAGNLNNKVLIDCTLPLVDRQIAVDGNSSGALEIARMAPTAHVVKAFHTIAFAHFANPMIDGVKESMFYCGDDAEAKQHVKRLAEEIGLDAVDCGPLFLSRHLEGIALMWIFLSVGMGYGDAIGFKLLRKQDSA